MSMKKAISSENAPKAIGPYSPAIQTDDFVFTAGQLGVDPVSGDLVPGGVQAETRQALQNLKAILEAAGSDLGKVVKTTVYLANIADFAAMNQVYGEFFTDTPPARSAFQVGALPKNALVEIESIALR